MADELNDFDELEETTLEDSWNEMAKPWADRTFKPKSMPPQWHTIESPYRQGMTLPAKLYDAVMFGDEPCPVCNGTGKIQVVQQWGDTEKQKTVSFPCPADRKRGEKMACIKRLLPPRYWRSDLYTLEPFSGSNMSVERQAGVIKLMKDTLKNNPYSGFFFYGEPGTGKTTFATALVRYALERDWKTHIEVVNEWAVQYNTVSWIHYLNWDTYIQSLLDWQNHPDTADEPTLTPTLIHRNANKGRTTCLVIEEIDKSRLTEFKANKLFELVCAVDATKSQLIMTTNYATKEEFQAWLCQGDTRIAGEAIWRRIVDNCKIVNCKGK